VISTCVFVSDITISKIFIPKARIEAIDAGERVQGLLSCMQEVVCSAMV